MAKLTKFQQALGYADGGSIDNLTDEQYLRRVEALGRNGPVSGGRRPEHLNASRDVNMPAQLMRGWAAGTLGLPGDLEGLGRLAIKGMGYTPKMTGLGALVNALGNKDIELTPTLPTSEFYSKEFLPGRDERPAGEFASGLGSLFGGVGASKVAQGVERGARGYAGIAAEALRRGVDEGRGPLGALQTTLGPLHAVRPRGGNVDPVAFGEHLTGLHRWVPEADAILRRRAGLPPPGPLREELLNKWVDTQLGNYLKKDLGTATDPLLQVEKEFPDLHLPEGSSEQWQGIADDIGANAAWGRQGRIYKEAYDRVKTHNELTGGAPDDLVVDANNRLQPRTPLTPWSTLSDSSLYGLDRNKYAQQLIKRRFGNQSSAADYADHLAKQAEAKGFRFDELLEHNPQEVNRAIYNHAHEYAMDSNGPYSLYGLAPHSPKHQELLDLFNQARDQIVPPWLQRLDPNKDKIWGVGGVDDNELGFNHVMDYLDQATGVHADLKLPGSTPDELRAKLADPNLDRDVARDYREFLALHDAGLTLDPQSLGRLSVADAVRRTARWNEHLASGMGGLADPDLTRGIVRTHKEYPEEGMRWVELGQPEMTPEMLGREGLPRGWTLTQGENGSWTASDPNSSYKVSDRDRQTLIDFVRKNHDPAKAELEAGLNAEGKAMGHCVGGYCDDVAERGTKIYSLRDKAGNPHVTVEVKAGKSLYHPVDIHPYLDDSERQAFSEHVGTPRSNRGNFYLPFIELHLPKTAENMRRSMPENIIQIKGKQNAAPVAKYLPFVQDFVRSGQWGSVGDLRNTGLVEAGNPSLIQHHQAMSPEQRKQILAAVGPDAHPRYWGNNELSAVNAEADKLFNATGVPVSRSSKLHELVVQAHQKAGTNYWGNHANFSGLYSPRELSLMGQYVAPGENLDFLKAMIQNERTSAGYDRFPDEVFKDFYDPPPASTSSGYARGGSIQKLAGGGKVGKLAARLAELAPEIGRAGAGSAKEARSAASRSGASFEQLSAHPEAVRERGGNFYDYDLGSYLGNESLKVIPSDRYQNPLGQWATIGGGEPGEAAVRRGPVADWANTQLVNYLKKDLGSPTDPLLQVEKELPNLHLPEDALVRNVGEYLRLRQRFGSDKFDNYLQRHKELTGTEIPTPWGLKSDEELRSYTPNTLIGGPLREIAELGTEPAGFPNITLQPTSRWVNEAFPAYAAHPENEGALGRFKWLQTAPKDTKIWGLDDSSSDPLHFGHVLDYLEAATEPYKKLSNWFTNPSELNEAVSKTLNNPWLHPDQPMVPVGRQEHARWKALHDVGLLLDPASLGRLSVADAVRKTARWNEHLASQGVLGDPDLARGIVREHKAYDDGHRWVELGRPELEPATELPKGLTTRQSRGDKAWHVIVNEDGLNVGGGHGGETPEAAVADYLKTYNEVRAKQDLEAGLNAEGKAMGHCVGGYCDDVAERGTKIYSLRDKAGNPHVTVEVKGRDPKSSEAWKLLDETVKASIKAEYPRGAWDSERLGKEALTTIERYAPEVVASLRSQNPAQIIQIKGKQNAAPVAKYLPFVQDFVKSGKWGEVGDLRNAGLIDISNWGKNLGVGADDTTRARIKANYGALFGPLGRHATSDELDAVTKKLGIGKTYDWNDLNQALSKYEPPADSYAKGGKVVRSRFEAAIAAKGR